MTLEEIFAGVPRVRILAGGRVPVTGIRYDSRKVRPGDLFAAVRGESVDGALFIPQARAAGATALLVERNPPGTRGFPVAVAQDGREALALAARNFFGDPSARLPVIGITGTNGKTTTAFIARNILVAAGIPAGLVGTVQYLVGGRAIPSSRTTPEASDLQEMMQAMERAGDRACVMEVSSHALAQKRVTGVRFAVAVFTNLTQDHLDYHGTMDEYFAVKAQLFAEFEMRAAVVNRDDPWGRRLLASLPDALSFGWTGGDIHPEGLRENVEWGTWGSRFTLSTPWGRIPVETSLAGSFNVENVMAAAGACGAMGIGPGAIAEGIASVGMIPGRFQKVERGQAFTALVDYAHTPDALEKLLRSARELAEGRLLLVFGCGGDRDRGKRPLMGKAAGELADLVVVTSDNPRSEDPGAIIREITAGMEGARARVCVEPDRRAAIRLAVAEARAGDVLAVAGKGHEDYQITGGSVLPFSDAGELAEAIDDARIGARGSGR